MIYKCYNAKIYKVIKTIHILNLQKGMIMLIVTHEMNFAKEVSNLIFYMDQGEIYEIVLDIK